MHQAPCHKGLCLAKKPLTNNISESGPRPTPRKSSEKLPLIHIKKVTVFPRIVSALE
jgi:hypothetical protein